MTRFHLRLLALATLTLAGAGLTACGTDDDGGSSATSSPSTSPVVPSVPTTRATTPPTTDGGGGMQAGAPSFMSFDVSSSAPCEGGNATAHMSFSTSNVVAIEIKVGTGNFETTAGYGPNESDVVASIPCSGAGTSSIQLRGCTESHDCVDSARQAVEITA